MAAFWGRFQILFVLSVLIERSVETYLKATKQDGEEFYDAANGLTVKMRDASQPASHDRRIRAVVLVAAVGGRIIGSLVTLNDGAEFAKAVVWNGVDIMVSAGLLAGGADVFH